MCEQGAAISVPVGLKWEEKQPLLVSSRFLSRISPIKRRAYPHACCCRPSVASHIQRPVQPASPTGAAGGGTGVPMAVLRHCCICFTAHKAWSRIQLNSSGGLLLRRQGCLYFYSQTSAFTDRFYSTLHLLLWKSFLYTLHVEIVIHKNSKKSL